jgi:hypothetical protein
MSPGTKKPPKPKEPDPKPVTYKWSYVSGKGREIVCSKDPANTCFLFRLWEGEVSDFHDAELQGATDAINTILSRVDRDNEDKKRELCMISIEGRLLLVWSRDADVLHSDDADGRMAKALGIKDDKR